MIPEDGTQVNVSEQKALTERLMKPTVVSRNKSKGPRQTAKTRSPDLSTDLYTKREFVPPPKAKKIDTSTLIQKITSKLDVTKMNEDDYVEKFTKNCGKQLSPKALKTMSFTERMDYDV